MTVAPLVSAITIFRNAEEYLEEAIHSAFAQTHPHWELLLIDDGSTDASPALAKHWAQRYPSQVRYLEHPGPRTRGMSASRNLGLAHARGEFIALLDGDSVWFPHKLAHQVSLLLAYPDVALILSPSESRYAETSVAGSRVWRPRPGYHPAGTWILSMLEDSRTTPEPSGVLFKRDVAVALGGFEEPFRDLFEGWVMWYKLGLHEPVYCDLRPVALHRRHAASSWLEYATDGKEPPLLRFYGWLRDYLGLQARRGHPYAQTAAGALALRLHAMVLRHFVQTEQFDLGIALAQCLEPQLSSAPGDAEWHYLLGFSLQQARTRLPDALQRYARALKLDFDEFWVRYNRGILHAHLRNLELAQADLLRAVELRPDHDGAREALRDLQDSSDGDRP